MWELVARKIMGETSTSAALEALSASVGRLQLLNDSTENIRPAYAALAEGTWWVAALDERILNGLGSSKNKMVDAYRAERDAHIDGRFIRGFLWARDRHTHQLPFSMSRDTTPFLGSGRGVIYISPGFIWRPSDQLDEPLEGRRSHPEWRPVYDELLAGKSARKSLSHCARWFHLMAGHPVS